MNKDTAKKLDNILSKIIESGGQDCDFYFNTSEELYDFEDYLRILDKDQYIIAWDADDKSCGVVISPKGRIFIKNGGYTGVIEEKERITKIQEEELQTQKLLLKQLENQRQSNQQSHYKYKKKNRGIVIYIGYIATFLCTLDGVFNGFQTLLHLWHRLLSLLQSLLF